jgi:hypothetical protein
LRALFVKFPFLQKLFADGGEQGSQFRRRKRTHWRVLRQKLSSAPMRPNVERGQQAGHHRVVLIIVFMPAVAADGMQLGKRAAISRRIVSTSCA